MNLKKTFLFAFIFSLMLPVSAQVLETEGLLKAESKITEDGWRTGGVSSLNFSQLYLSNWAAGGENSYSFNGLVSLFASYKKGSLIWDNTLDMGYGFLNQSSFGYKKTDDKFDFLSKFSYKAFDGFYYSGLFNFKTQFTPGYKYKTGLDREKISTLFAPAYAIGALGLNYQPNNYFTAFFAPITGRLTIVGDEELSAQGKYGVKPGEKTRGELGAYLRTVYSKNDFEAAILKNVTFTSKLDLFSNYLKDPHYIDVNWDVLVALKVNRYLSVNISTSLIYDYDIKFKNKDGKEKSKIQFKELLGIGFSYSF